jgi:hypothetical protein
MKKRVEGENGVDDCRNIKESKWIIEHDIISDVQCLAFLIRPSAVKFCPACRDAITQSC